MPMSIEWMLPNRILYERLYGAVTLDDLRTLQRECLHMMETSGIAPIHIVVDFSGATDFPRNIPQLRNALVYTGTMRLGNVILITQNPLIRFLSTVVAQLRFYSMILRCFDDRESALAHLLEQDASLVQPQPLQAELPHAV